MKKQYVIKTIVCFILTVILIAGNIIQSHASQTESGSAGDWSGSQKRDFITNNLIGLTANTVGVIFGSSSTQDLSQNFQELIRAKAIQDNVSYDEWWSQQVHLTPSNPQAPSVSDPSDYNVTNINVSYEFKDILLQAAQETMAQNPVDYIDITIPSIKFLDTSMNWNNYSQYKSLVDFVSGLENGYVSMAYWYVNNTTKVGNIQILYVPKDINYALIGTVNGGLCDIKYAIDWSLTETPTNLNNKIKIYLCNQNGVITDVTSSPQPTSIPWRNITNKTSFGLYGNDLNLMTTNSRNEHDYVFPNINAFKAYNSGNPQPYYVSSNYTGSVSSGNSSFSTSQINSGNSSYSNVVNNIQSGMSADEVIKLVDTIMNNMNNGGGSGGSGGGSDDDDDDGGSVIGNIIRKLGDFVSGLIDGIGDALESIVNSIVGYTDENGVEHPGIFQGLINLISSGVVGFLSAVFSFLPTEIVTVISAGIILSILFAVIHFIRGR